MTAPTAERIRDLRIILAHAVGPSTAAPLRDALAALDYVAERLRDINDYSEDLRTQQRTRDLLLYLGVEEYR
jgi:hypothetical protein